MKPSRRRGLAVGLLGVLLGVASAATEPHFVELELTAGFRNAEFARAPYLEGLASLRFDPEQPWAVALPPALRLDVEGERVAGAITLSGPGRPTPGSTLGFWLGGHRFDLALEGLRFEPPEAGGRSRARLPVLLQVEDPDWVVLYAELLEVEGLRPRLRLSIENHGPRPFLPGGVAIRAERRATNAPSGGCLDVPDAELPKVHWNWQGAATDAAGETRREEGTRLSTVRVGGCGVRWMATSLPLSGEVEPGGRRRLLLTPLPRTVPSPALGGARVDQLSGWDALRVSLTSEPGEVWPDEVVLRPRR